MDRIKLATEMLDERLSITYMPHSTAADKAYYNGMIQLLRCLGYDVLVDDSGKHTLISDSE